MQTQFWTVPMSHRHNETHIRNITEETFVRALGVSSGTHRPVMIRMSQGPTEMKRVLMDSKPLSKTWESENSSMTQHTIY
jgi:hypothetical protein